MPSKKRTTRVRFVESSRAVDPPGNALLAWPAASSNISSPLTASPQITTFDNTIEKVFSGTLLSSLTNKYAVLKEVRDYILNINEERLKQINPYIHSYCRYLHVRYGCVCIEEKIAIPNVLRGALLEDMHASHRCTWGIICMAIYCSWPYMSSELSVRSTECKPCTAIGTNLKSVILAKQFHSHISCAELNQ